MEVLNFHYCFRMLGLPHKWLLSSTLNTCARIGRFVADVRGNALDDNAQTQSHHGQFGKLKQTIRRSQGNAPVRANGLREAALAKQTIKGPQSKFFTIPLQGFRQE